MLYSLHLSVLADHEYYSCCFFVFAFTDHVISTGCRVWRGRDCGGDKRVCKNCDTRGFCLCKVGLYSGATGLPYAQVPLSLSLSVCVLSRF
jgi:hypothetical protein